MNKYLLAVGGLVVGLAVGFFLFRGSTGLKGITPSTKTLDSQDLANELSLISAPLVGYSAAPTVDFASLVATSTQLTATTSVTGASVGDYVLVSAVTPTTGAIFSGAVTSANVVTIYFANGTNGTVDPASSVFNVRVLPNAAFTALSGL